MVGSAKTATVTPPVHEPPNGLNVRVPWAGSYTATVPPEVACPTAIAPSPVATRTPPVKVGPNGWRVNRWAYALYSATVGDPPASAPRATIGRARTVRLPAW